MDTQVNRSQSEVLGVVLLFGLTIVSVTAVVVMGSVALSDTQQSADIEGVSQSMTQFASQASLVAHGDSGSQTVSIGGSADAIHSIDESAGTLYIETPDDSASVDMGTVKFEKDGDSVAYQGGGVWKMKDGGPTMVSPPEFHYRVVEGGSPTLTLPLVSVKGDHVGSDLRVSALGETEPLFDTIQTTGGSVDVTVQSEYYLAWGQFFESRTTGSVEYDHDENNATVTLLAPAEGGEVDSGVLGGGNALNFGGGSGFIDGYSEGIYGGSPDEETTVKMDGDLSDEQAFEVYGDVHVSGDMSISQGGTEITGNVYVDGDMTIDQQPTLAGEVHVGGDLADNAQGQSFNFQDDVFLRGSVYDLNSTVDGDVHAGGSQSLDGVDLDIVGDLLIRGDADGLPDELDVSNIHVAGTMVLERIDISGDVMVGEEAVVAEGEETNIDTLHVDGDVTIEEGFSGNIQSTGSVELDAVDGSGTYDVEGDITATGDVLVDATSFGGDIDAGGDVTVVNGGSVSGSITAGGTISGASGTENASPAPEGQPNEVRMASNPDPAEVRMPKSANGTIDQVGDELEDDNDNADAEDIDEATNQLDCTSCSLESGQYYLEEIDIEDTLVLDTSDGDVDIFVRNEVVLNNPDTGDEIIEVTGDGRANFYLDDDLTFTHQAANVRAPEDRGNQTWFYMNTTNRVSIQGDIEFQGVIYGPGGQDDSSVIDIEGNQPAIFGALVGDIQGAENGVEIHYDKSLKDAVAVDPGNLLEEPEVSYLHVSVTEVEVD